MTTRSDILVDFEQSPRIAEIAEPSTALNMQDTVDTLRKKEDGFSTGLAFDKLLNASGKEDLGGGIAVGITVALQNTKVAFEARRTPAESGTVTTGSGPTTPGILGPIYSFTDTAADFDAAGILPGSMVINFTDRSIADVTLIDNLNTLTTKVLVNGITNTFQIGDVYQVFNIIQCDLDGGNLVAVDDLGASFSAILPTAFTQVVRTSSSSATLAEQQDIQFSSFGGGITVDLTSLNSGTVFPSGTPRSPVNNFADALDIANVRGFTQFFVLGDAVIDDSLDFTGFTFVGESQNKTLFTVDPDANVTNSEFLTATITGTLDGGNVLDNCQILTLSFVEGFIQSCVLNGPITLSGTDDAHFLDCWSGIPGVMTPTIDFGGSGSGLSLRNYNGGIRLINKSGANDAASLDMASGQIILEDSITAGDIVLRGVGKWTNEETYVGGANVIVELISSQDTQFTAFDNAIHVDTINGTAGTIFPIGTQRFHCNNLTDAVAIAAIRGITIIRFHGSLTLGTETDWMNFTIIGDNVSQSLLTVQAAATTIGVEIRDTSITGVISGNNTQLTGVLLDNCTVHSGEVIRSGLRAVTLNGNVSDRIRFIDCYGAGDPQIIPPSIDFGGDGPIVTMFRYGGVMTFTNKTGSAPVAMMQQGGTLTLDSTVTKGIVFAYGLINVLIDNSTGTTDVQDFSVSSDQGIINTLNTNVYDGKAFSEIIPDLLSMANGKIVEDPAGSGIFKFYAQNNTTVLYTLTKAGNERTRT